MNKDNTLSLARSALKIVGAMAIAMGYASTGQVDQITTGLFEMIGTAMTLGGLFWSLWHHTPDEVPASSAPPITLRTLAPDSIPPDVAAKMAETQLKG